MELKRYHWSYEDMEEHPEGGWVQFEDVQQACIESYRYGEADVREQIKRALGLSND